MLQYNKKGLTKMNYDAILAIYNCFKDKINYLPPEHNLKKEIPYDVKNWYEEWKKNQITESIKEEKNISSIKEGLNGEKCFYYFTPRLPDSRIITDTSDKDKALESLLNQSHTQMVKETIYQYLSTILTGIEIPPFDVKKLEDQSVYECKAYGNNSEQIKIDYDELKLTTCIKITTPDKYLKISMLPTIISTRYDGMITIPQEKTKSSLKNIFNIFQKKSRFELTNQEKADFISITKDEVNSICNANGTIYAQEGVYIFDVTSNTFTINYFDQETINTITSTNLNKKFELTNLIKILRDKKELTNTNFIEKLESTGLLPNATFSIPCTPKELQILVNKAFIDSKKLIEDLYKTN